MNFLIGIAFLVGLTVLLRREDAKRKRDAANESKRKGGRAVRVSSDEPIKDIERKLGIQMFREIVYTNDSRTCEAVKKYKGKYFDSDNDIKLPVPGCDAEKCRCVFVHATKNTMGR
jgi:hypothetical protein